MAVTEAIGTSTSDSLASLERLKQIETDGDARLRAVRGKIELLLSELRADSESQIQAAKKQAEEEAATVLERAQKDAEAEALRILDQARDDLALRAKAGLPDLTTVWPGILGVLFGEFR